MGRSLRVLSSDTFVLPLLLILVILHRQHHLAPPQPIVIAITTTITTVGSLSSSTTIRPSPFSSYSSAHSHLRCNHHQYIITHQIIIIITGMGMYLTWSERRAGTPPTQVRVPGAARDFSFRVNFQCRLCYVCPHTPVFSRTH